MSLTIETHGSETHSFETHSFETPAVSSATGVRLTSAAPALWRVIDRSGRVIGHLEARAGATGVRYRARLFHPPTRSFRELGEFWSADDAVDCLRFAR